MSAPAGRRPWAAAMAVAATCAVLAGCGDADGADDPGTSPSPSSVDGLTPDGTELAVGDTATVPLVDGAGVVALTITSVEPGADTLLTDKKLEGTPTFIRMKATVVSGDAYPFRAWEYVNGYAGDERYSLVASPATIGPCSWESFEVDPAPGTSIEPCVTVIVPPDGAAVDEVAYAFDDDTRNLDDLYATWSVG